MLYGRKNQFSGNYLIGHCFLYITVFDPMHITKNVCNNTLNTLMSKGTVKDSLETHMDMLGLRKELHPITLEDGQRKLPIVLWVLKKEGKTMLYSFFNKVKVPMYCCAKRIGAPSMEKRSHFGVDWPCPAPKHYYRKFNHH
jgi:hypothetical protein